MKRVLFDTNVVLDVLLDLQPHAEASAAAWAAAETALAEWVRTDRCRGPVAAVRERFGDRLALQVDANAAYTLADAGHLAALDRFGLLLIEQPLPEEDLLGHAELQRRLRTPICLDESITSARAAADALALGACRIVNVKAGRMGGYLEARRLHDLCHARGVPLWCGGMLATGIGLVANSAVLLVPSVRSLRRVDQSTVVEPLGAASGAGDPTEPPLATST